MLRINRSLWERDYSQIRPREPRFNSQSPLDSFLASTQTRRTIGIDEFDKYIAGDQVEYTNWSEHNVFEWWMQSPFPSLRQWAFDTLSVPAMSAEVERVFSQARRFVTQDRNRLGDDMVEVLQCLKHWWDSKILG